MGVGTILLLTFIHMINRSIVDYTILDAVSATGVGKTINVTDFRNIVVKI